MRIQTLTEREVWKAELRPKVEAIYRGHVGAGADAILADIAALDDQFGPPDTAPVVLNMASLINQPGTTHRPEPPHVVYPCPPAAAHP